MYQLVTNQRFVKTYLEGRWTAELQLAVSELRLSNASRQIPDSMSHQTGQSYEDRKSSVRRLVQDVNELESIFFGAQYDFSQRYHSAE